MERACRGVADADGQDQNQSRDQNIAGLGEVDLVLDDVAHADCGDHAVEHEADAADGAAGHGGDDGRELRAEGEEHGQNCRDADDARVIDAAEGQNAGVFAVGRVGGRAEEGCQRGRKTVAHQGAVQAGIFNVVAVAGGGDRGHVADVLDHGGKGQRDDGDDGGQELVCVDIAGGEQAEDGLLHLDGQREPLRFGDVGDEICADVRVEDDGQQIRADDAEEDRDDLDHALAPDVGGDDDEDGGDGDPPAAGAVIDGGGGEVQADGDDDGAGDDGREEAHDLLRAEDLEQTGQNDIHKTCAGHAEAGIGQHLKVGDVLLLAEHRRDGRVAAEEGEGRAEEGRDLAAGDEVEQQRAEAREQKRVRNVEARQDGDEDGRAEHGEHMLEAEQQHSASAELSGIIDAGFRNFVFSHGVLLSFRRFCGRSGLYACIKKEL